MTLAPSTVRGREAGPATEGRAHLLDRGGGRRARRLLQPGGPLFASYLLYRIRGHRMQVYEVRLNGPGESPPPEPAPAMTTARVYRAVQLTARTSALLFSAAQATSALGPRHRAGAATSLPRLHGGARRTFRRRREVRRRQRRPRPVPGRAEPERGRWLANGGGHLHLLRRPGRRRLGCRCATSGGRLAMRVDRAGGHLGSSPRCSSSVYLGQLPRSRWYALPATAVIGAVAAKRGGRGPSGHDSGGRRSRFVIDPRTIGSCRTPIDCVVVGAGPAGLAASMALSGRQIDHLVLERISGRPQLAHPAVGLVRAQQPRLDEPDARAPAERLLPLRPRRRRPAGSARGPLPGP